MLVQAIHAPPHGNMWLARGIPVMHIINPKAYLPGTTDVTHNCTEILS